MRIIARVLDRIAALFDDRPKAFRTSDIHLDVYVCNTFSNAHVASVANGVSMWERLTNGSVSWQLHVVDVLASAKPQPNGNACAVYVHSANKSDEWVIEWETRNKAKRSLVGMCSGDPRSRITDVYLVCDRMTSRRMFEWTVAHEVGHSMAMKHVANDASIMSSHYNWAYVPSEHDVTEFDSSSPTLW